METKNSIPELLSYSYTLETNPRYKNGDKVVIAQGPSRLSSIELITPVVEINARDIVEVDLDRNIKAQLLKNKEERDTLTKCPKITKSNVKIEDNRNNR